MFGDFELRKLQKEQLEKWFYSTPLAPQRLLGLLVLLLEISIPANCHLSTVSIIDDPTLVPLNAILWLPSPSPKSHLWGMQNLQSLRLNPFRF